MIHTINSNMYLEGGNRGEFSTDYCQQKKKWTIIIKYKPNSLLKQY